MDIVRVATDMAGRRGGGCASLYAALKELTEATRPTDITSQRLPPGKSSSARQVTESPRHFRQLPRDFHLLGATPACIQGEASVFVVVCLPVYSTNLCKRRWLTAGGE